MNYTEIVCMGIKTKDHSDFMNELNLRMILWSTAEAVLRLFFLCEVSSFFRSYGLLRKRY